MGESALVQELAHTREALDTAIRIGEGLQARVDAALAIVRELPPTVERFELLVALEGKP